MIRLTLIRIAYRFAIVAVLLGSRELAMMHPNLLWH